MMTLNVLSIIEGTSVDGPGLRTSIYLAGCRHHCPHCHNPQSWNAGGGTPMTIEQIMDIVAYNEAPVTLSGGDPLMQAPAVTELVRRIKLSLGYNVWCYTGYRWEDIVADDTLLNAVKQVDVVVDGPYVHALRDLSLHFRGSSNQRLIDVPATLRSNDIVSANLQHPLSFAS